MFTCAFPILVLPVVKEKGADMNSGLFLFHTLWKVTLTLPQPYELGILIAFNTVGKENVES